MYYTTISPSGQTIIIRIDKNLMISFHENPENIEYQNYIAWINDGNSPEPWQEQ